jgi:hypothetical protein
MDQRKAELDFSEFPKAKVFLVGIVSLQIDLLTSRMFHQPFIANLV